MMVLVLGRMVYWLLLVLVLLISQIEQLSSTSLFHPHFLSSSTPSSSSLLLPYFTSILGNGKSNFNQNITQNTPSLASKNETPPSSSSSSLLRKDHDERIMVVTFVNGIYHSVEDWQRISDYLKELFQVEVYPFYNPSSGSWVKDATKAGFELVTRPSDLELSKQLAKHLREALNKVGESGRVLHIAHSGGAILTYLAAKHHLTISETNRIDVATFGAGKSITHKYFKGRLCNYYAKNDPLTLIDKRVNQLLKKIAHNKDAEVVSIRDHKHNTSFVFLAAKHHHPVTDHSMEGEPYRNALAIEAEVFQATMQSLKLARAKERNVVRKLRKISANITGIHHFWDSYIFDNSELMIRRIRKNAASLTGMRGFFSGKRSMSTSETIDEKEVFGSVANNEGNNTSCSSASPTQESTKSNLDVGIKTLANSNMQKTMEGIISLDQLQFEESI